MERDQLASSPIQPLRFGLAGLGPGMMTLIPGFERSPYATIVAAAEPRADARRAFADRYGVPAYATFDELCADDNVEALWIATPNHLHAIHVIAAAAAGKHIIISKPMAVTLDECGAMNAAAARHGVQLLAGHTQSVLLPIRKLAELVRSGQYGKLAMAHTWHYTDWMYRPRMPYELDETQGGGVVYRQAPHQIDIIRLIGGGLVRSVRATTMSLDPARPAAGAYTVWLQFADGAPATIVYNGYGHFDAGELTFGVGRGGFGGVARGLSAEEEAKLKAGSGFGGAEPRERPGRTGGGTHQPFGLTLVSCERADLRQSPAGLLVYDHNGVQEIALSADEQRGEAEIEELYHAVRAGQPLTHDGRWGEATQEVAVAILESARTGREIVLQRQVAAP